MSAPSPLTPEDLERRLADEPVTRDDVNAVLAALRSVMAERAVDQAAVAMARHHERDADQLRGELRSVMAERDRAESHAKRAETLAHDLQAQVLALRSLFVNWRWDGPAWIKPEEHRAMEEANRLAGGKPLDQ